MTNPSTSRIDLDGKVAVVTGASRGLGRAIARTLCASGCHVLLNYAHSAEVAAQTVAELSGLRGTAAAIQGDVREPEALAVLLGRVQTEHDRLDIFVHNAATFRPMLALAPDPEAFHREQQLALNPLLYGAPTLAKTMPDGGRVIAISSNGARGVIPNYVATGVAKAALESLIRYLAVDFGPLGITVNAVATALLDKGPDTTNPEIAGFLGSRTPNGRLTTPDDVADVVGLLCTPQARWLQGQVITVDGGLGLRS
ncbi:MAG: SDR family oxidoreductase [Geodermatophilaceae bacterium]